MGYDENEPVTLSVDTTGSAEGQYSYTFDVVAPEAINSPQTITINLRIGPILVPQDYPTIQPAIDASVSGDTIIVSPGTYYEKIIFDVNDVILTSIEPENAAVVESTIIESGGSGYVVAFSGGVKASGVLRGFTITSHFGCGGIWGNGTHASIEKCIITNNRAYGGGGLYDCDGLIADCVITGNRTFDDVYASGGGLSRCDGTIRNCTITDNMAGGVGGGLYDCDGTITNCIIWGNSTGGISEDQLYYSSTPTYSCIQDWTRGGTGNITSDPLFADANNNDYHLKSEYGRWNPEEQVINDNDTPTDANDDFWETVPGQWVTDAVTSPCIDAGDPVSDWTEELWPHGKRINMGAYGGTAQASMSSNPIGNIADLDHDGEVGVSDLLLLSEDWLYAEYLLDTDLNRNGVVDIADFADLAGQWLWGFN